MVFSWENVIDAYKHIFEFLSVIDLKQQRLNVFYFQFICMLII